MLKRKHIASNHSYGRLYTSLKCSENPTYRMLFIHDNPSEITSCNSWPWPFHCILKPSAGSALLAPHTGTGTAPPGNPHDANWDAPVADGAVMKAGRCDMTR